MLCYLLSNKIRFFFNLIKKSVFYVEIDLPSPKPGFPEKKIIKNIFLIFIYIFSDLEYIFTKFFIFKFNFKQRKYRKVYGINGFICGGLW